MATVAEIQARLARESAVTPVGPSVATEVLSKVEGNVISRNQPTAKPTRKVTAAFVGGVLSLVATWVATRFGVEIPEEMVAAGTALLATVFGYAVPEA